MINQHKMKKYLRQIEFSAQEHSKDDSTKVGAMILDKDDYTPKTWGYNGMPRGANDHNKARLQRPEKYKWMEHAERNAIANAAKVGTALAGSCIVVNMFPCIECARMIVQSGIKDVVAPTPDMSLDRDQRWAEDYKRSLELFDECNVNVHTIEPKELGFEAIRHYFKYRDDPEFLNCIPGESKEERAKNSNLTPKIK